MLKDIRASRIISAFTVNHTRVNTHAIHSRFAYGLSLALDGEIVYSHRGNKYVSDTDHVMILPKGQDYELSCTRTGRFTLVNFEPTPDFSRAEFGRYRISNKEKFLELQKSLELLSLSTDECRDVRMLSVFYDMIAHLVEELSPMHQSVRVAQKFIEERMDDPELSNTDIAAHIGISEVYLRKLFSAHLKTSPKQYVQSVRISRAKVLLLEGVENVGDIARKCGYSDVYTFCHAFKRITGYSPMEYRTRAVYL